MLTGKKNRIKNLEHTWVRQASNNGLGGVVVVAENYEVRFIEPVLNN